MCPRTLKQITRTNVFTHQVLGRVMERNQTKLNRLPRPHLEHKVDSTSVRGDSHSTASWDRLVACHRNDGLRIRQGLNLQTVLLHQGHGRRVYALEVAWETNGQIEV